MNNHIHPPSKPNLVKRKIIINIPKTTRVVIGKQSHAPINKPVQITKSNGHPNAVSIHNPNIVTQKTSTRKTTVPKKHKTTIQYLGADVGPEAAARLRNIKNTGTGKILIIVANGPSINEVKLERLKRHDKIKIMSINTPDPRLWPTDYWAFFDLSQQRRHETIWNDYTGIIFNSGVIKRLKPSSIQIKNHSSGGFSTNLLDGMHVGRSSVYAAMQIAYWMGFDHTYLFGVDMAQAGLNGLLHFYGTNPDVKPEIRRERFAAEAEHYERAATILNESERAKYTFCSDYNTWPFVKKFSSLSHHTAVETILNSL